MAADLSELLHSTNLPPFASPSQKTSPQSMLKNVYLFLNNLLSNKNNLDLQKMN